MDNPVTNNKSNKTSGQEKGNNKRCHNNNVKDKKYFCMLHGHNPTHITKQCITLKKEAEKHKKTCQNGKQKNSKCAYNPTKDKIHALAVFAKDAMKNEYNNVNKELANFENMSVSGNEKDK